MVRYVFFLLMLGMVVATNDCMDRVVDNCSIDQDTLLGSLPLNSQSECQFVCEMTTGCLVFVYDRETAMCQLVSQDYRASCKTFGGPVVGSMEDCQEACGQISESRCSFYGQSLDSYNGEVESKEDCQLLCRDMAGEGCQYWVYNDDTKECSLLRTGSRICQGIAGPSFNPPVDDCVLPTVPGKECDRECDGSPLHCIFNWRTQHRWASCSEDDNQCIGDGIERLTTVIVDEVDGTPTIASGGIYACEDDLITVNLVNDLDIGTTIHWHGIPQGPDNPTPWADGVPGFTQCEVHPNEQFPFYQFQASPPGTYWFHSHSEFQRDDGAYGPLVIRDTQPTLDNTCDLTEHSIMIQELYSTTAEYRYTHNKDEPPTSLLINGKGRQNDPGAVQTPWQIFSVDPSQCRYYRFRVISAVDLHCPVVVSIEDHNMTVIASDGQYIVPEDDIASLTVANGERYDFLIDTEGKEMKAYQIRFGGSPSEFANCNGLSSLALLQYGSSSLDMSISPNYQQSTHVPGYHLNPLPYIPLPENQIPVHITDLRSVNPMPDQNPVTKTFYVVLGDGDIGAHLNNLKFDINSMKTPFLSQTSDFDMSVCHPSYDQGVMCDPSTDPDKCSCVHMLEARFGEVVEIFLINPAGDKPIAHPLHLHGTAFSVLASGTIPEDNPALWVKQENENGNIERNLSNPPLKDSIQTIPGGYLLIRFVADNPGFWAMHCHISFDVIEGQLLVVKVGQAGDWHLPLNFPTCGH